nr:hypothetical protein DM860_014699 [Ipomoea batatas]
MEGIAAAIVEHDNKENIPPLSAEKFIPKPSKTKLFKKRIPRRPLRDITHLFNTPIQSNSPVSSPLLPSAASSNTRKRKLAETRVVKRECRHDNLGLCDLFKDLNPGLCSILSTKNASQRLFEPFSKERKLSREAMTEMEACIHSCEIVPGDLTRYIIRTIEEYDVSRLNKDGY